MSQSIPTTISVRDPDIRENWANAVRAVEDETGKELSRGRGQAAADELSAQDVLDELAVAYTGYDVAEVDDDE